MGGYVAAPASLIHVLRSYGVGLCFYNSPPPALGGGQLRQPAHHSNAPHPPAAAPRTGSIHQKGLVKSNAPRVANLHP